MERVRSLIRSLREIGFDPDGTPEENKYIRSTNAAAGLAGLATVVFFILEVPVVADYEDLGTREFVIIGLRFAASLLFLIPLFLNHARRHRASRLFFGLLVIAFALGLGWMYGDAAPSHMFFIAMVAAFVAIFPPREKVTMWVLIGLVYAGFALALYLHDGVEPIVPVERPEIRVVIEVLVSLGAVTLVLLLALAQRRAFDAAEREVVVQREKADELLLNILPEPIAKRLKEYPGAIADGFDEVTVMFADLVGFTPLSQTMSPQDLVGLMDQIFSEFDNAAERHGLEKIKTIGDAYMVAGGIPLARPDHADAIADMALDLLPIVDRIETPTGSRLQIRVGIACGAAVAGVIGKKKFSYDVWGDTVNTASRMESHSEAGRIQVNESAYLKLRERYEFIERGTVAIKGKGEIPTWFLTGKKKKPA